MLITLSFSDNPLPSVMYINFADNSANVTGNILHGGLLDRCTPSLFTEFIDQTSHNTAPNATSFFLSRTNLEQWDLNSTANISSDPVRVCFCKDNEPGCEYQPPPMYVNNGEMFNVSVVAVDHLNHPIPNTIIHALISVEAGLSERQSVQSTNIDGTCTNLSYSMLSPRNLERLVVHAEGPCANIGISSSSFAVNIVPCPIGFNKSNLHCDCDPVLFPGYVSNCSIDTQSVLRKDNVWFAFVNSTEHEGFVFQRNCPFDYCLPSNKEVHVNLNVINGSDKMCAYSRSGKLCGSCKDGLSLTFGGSKCLKCSHQWLGMIIVFAIAGVLLVAFVLVCNLTVAVGTINGLIFYANIITTNRAEFFPFETPNVLTVFIAWVNLDFGFTSCFYDGMDGYAKTWLQFVFPCYILFLVVMVIFVANHSNKFAEFLRQQCNNPVAALSTLVLLSYAKFLRIIIAVFSSATLTYSDGHHETVWLFDASVPYFGWKHSLLFIAAFVLLLIGLCYTLLVLLWQWLYSQSHQKIFKRIAKFVTTLNDFMKTYQDPYTDNHRYWTGVLLLVRIILCVIIISACNDADNASISIVCIAGGLLMFKDWTGNVYKMKLRNILENSYIFNLTLFAAISLYLRESNTKGQLALACISTSIALVTFVATVFYHMYVYVLNKGKVVKKLFSRHPRKITFEFPAIVSGQYQGTLTTRPTSVSEVETPEMLATLKIEASTIEVNVVDDVCTTEEDDENKNKTSGYVILKS